MSQPIKPQQFAVYKNLGASAKFGALQFNLQPTHYACKNQGCKGKNFTDSTPVCTCETPEMEQREGCVFLDAASPIPGGNTCNWKEKIILALNMTDLGKLLFFLRVGKTSGKNPSDTLSLVHDRYAGTDRAGEVMKTVRVWSPNGTTQGAMVTIQEKNGDTSREHKIPLSGDDIAILGTLVQAAIVKIVGW